MQALSQSLLHCLQKLDVYLGTSPDFLLGRWLASARASATSAAEADLFEFDARNQLVMWGPTPEVGPSPDYACMHWSGLVGRYYHQRWAIYLDILVNQSVIPGKSLPAGAFISAQLDAFAQRFCQGTWNNETYPTNAAGPARTLELSGALLDEFNDASGSALAGFTKHAGKDHMLAADSNLGHEIVSDLGRMAVLCNTHPRCVAFNSNGTLSSCRRFLRIHQIYINRPKCVFKLYRRLAEILGNDYESELHCRLLRSHGATAGRCNL